MQSECAFVKITYADSISKEGYLVDMTDGVGTLQELDGAATTFSVYEVVLDVLAPAEGQATLAKYPFEKDDVVIFRDGQDHLQGCFVRKAEREGGILVFACGTLRGIYYSHIVRVRKPACDFHVPPAYLGARERVPATSILLMPAEGPHANITYTFTAWNTDYQLYGHSDAPDATPEKVCVPSIWEAASNLLRTWANEASPIKGYYKVDYRVSYQNGQVFKSVYLLLDKGAEQADLGGDMRSTCAMYSGRELPAGLPPEEKAAWQQHYVTTENIAYFGALLDHYEIASNNAVTKRGKVRP